MMTDQEQLNRLSKYLFDYSHEREHLIRDMGRQAVEAYGPQPSLGAVLANDEAILPVKTSRGHINVRVRLIEAVRDHPFIAQLIAEEIIREQLNAGQ